jgi:hypothetical protein
MRHIFMEISQGTSLHRHLYLKQTKMSFLYFFLFSSTKLEKRRAEQVLPCGGGGWYLGGERG